jgi:hypothetical protein
VDAYFGPKTSAFSAKNPLPWTQRDCSVCTACRTPYAQVQPAVPAVGALVIEQGRVGMGMGGGQRGGIDRKLSGIRGGKLVTQKFFILQ